jgi:hypothetical protein
MDLIAFCDAATCPELDVDRTHRGNGRNDVNDPQETFHLTDACVSCNVEVNPYRAQMKSGCYAPGRFVVPGRTEERVRP